MMSDLKMWSCGPEQCPTAGQGNLVFEVGTAVQNASLLQSASRAVVSRLLRMHIASTPPENLAVAFIDGRAQEPH